jgi:hypothetical protein
MTLHIVLPAAEPNSFVWVTDTVFNISFDNSASLEKIAYFEDQGFACSAWGNFALILRDELAKQIREDPPDMANPEAVKDFLRLFATKMAEALEIKLSPSARENPGLILTTFADGFHRLYCCLLGKFPAAVEPGKLTCMGDENSPARVFVDYYYEASGKSIEQVLLLGIHAMRLAHRNKAAFIGEPNAWVYRGGIFRRLTAAELTRYIEMSKSLDASIASYAVEPVSGDT